MKRKRHSPEQIIRKLRTAEQLLNQRLLKKPDRLQHNLFQRSKRDKLTTKRAIDDCYNC